MSSKVSEKFRAMGTDVEIDIITDSPDGAEKEIEEARNIFVRNEKIFSRFRGDSELSNINKNLDREISVSEEMKGVLELCLKFNKLSGGYFDPRIIGNLEKIGYDKDFRTNDLNSGKSENIILEKIEGELAKDLIINQEKGTVIVKKRIDTTGIAKGYAVDAAADYLKKQNFENFIVDAGGDMYAQGSDDGKDGWLIGIEGLDDERIMLRLKNAGIATSGISRKRWMLGNKKVHHLINPKDPENFSHEIKTVTVIEDKAVEADGRAKALVLMGKEKGMEFANDNKIKALFLDYKGNVYLSEAIKKDVIKNF